MLDGLKIGDKSMRQNKNRITIWYIIWLVYTGFFSCNYFFFFFFRTLIFQCGWETKSLYTIFKYIFTCLSNDLRCGKTLSHWFFNKSNEIHGGVLPTLEDIKTEPDLVNLFVNSLFVHRTQLTHM